MKRLGTAAAVVTLVLLAGSCGHDPSPKPVAAPPVAAPAVPLPAAAPATYDVGLRVLQLQRGPNRPLPTLVFYPAVPRAAAGLGAEPEVAPLAPASGRFPLVLFSHGLSGSPERYAAALSSWASAGFVVVAPTFPYTSEFTTHFRRRDIVNQPDDVRFVLEQVRRLDVRPGDPLRGRIDLDRIAAVGHSAGGYTTSGLFVAGHDPRIRAGVIMAGWRARGAFAGPRATMLFLQGTADPVVPMAVSRAAYDRVPWAKTYLLLRRNSHATYLRPGEIGYPLMDSTVINFLRWTLDGDQAAHRRLPRFSYPGRPGPPPVPNAPAA
jgi:dienelactone hydrolase